MAFLDELKRRKVIRVALVYAATAFVVLQAADLLATGLALPAWVFAAITVAAIAGFPLALVLAWAYDVTPGGVVRTDAAGADSASAGLTAGETRVPRLRSRWTSRRVAAASAVALVVVVIGGAFTARALSRAQVDDAMDAGIVAVLPFRVAGAEPSLGYLREGMLDLLAAKLDGAAGPRAVDPRTVIVAWRRAGGTATDDPPAEAALALARGLGAGRLVLGEVASMPGRIVLSASLADVRTGRPAQAFSVEGPLDSLPALVDRLAAGLLSLGAGERKRLAALTTTSLPALRAYLEGRAADRSGRSDAAFTHFSRAVELDSTFALGALMLSFSAGWELDATALDLAWRYRERLGAGDRALLESFTGPDYPRPHSPAARLRSAEALVRARPDDPTSWGLLQSALFIWGTRVDMPDTTVLRRSLEAAHRALSLDSTDMDNWGGVMIHAAHSGDTVALRRYLAHVTTVEPTHVAVGQLRMLLDAHTLGEAGLDRITARFDSLDATMRLSSLSLLEVSGRSDVARKVAAHLRSRMSETEIAAVAGPLHPLIMSSGQHAEAQRYQQAQLRTGGITALNHRARHVRYALHWDGDPDSARVAVAELEAAFLSSPPERNLSNTACALAQWRLAHGDTAVSPYIEGLRRWSAAAAAGTVATELSCADILVTWRAAVTGASDAPALIARLDSLLREWAWGSMLENEGNLILARLLEERGDDAGALRVLRRLPPMVVGWGPYGSTFVRERGRVAALVGDTADAVNAYRLYLALRADADAHLQPDVQRVGDELLRLTRGRQ
jgi:TolB-like protein